MPPRQLAEDAKHGMQPPQFRPPPQFLEPPQLMTMQQHNMVVNTLMMGGTLDLRWSRFTAWGPERIPLLNLPKYGILAGIPVEWDHGRLCIQRRRIPHSWVDALTGVAAACGTTTTATRSTAYGATTTTRTCQKRMSYSVPRGVRGGRGSGSFSSISSWGLRWGEAKQPPRLWLDAQAST